MARRGGSNGLAYVAFVTAARSSILRRRVAMLRISKRAALHVVILSAHINDGCIRVSRRRDISLTTFPFDGDNDNRYYSDDDNDILWAVCGIQK